MSAWRKRTEAEPNGKAIRLCFETDEGPLFTQKFFELLRDDAEFRTYFSSELAAMPYKAFRWETPVQWRSLEGNSFHCIVVDDPHLTDPPDCRPFTEYFRTHARNGVATFPNLGKDAVLVVPCPIADDAAYGHLAAFVREAPAEQQHELWKQVAEAMFDIVPKRAVWLSTAGAGVAWLHVRLDSRPKYYWYRPYKQPPM
jgi:hypothetical protein